MKRKGGEEKSFASSLHSASAASIKVSGSGSASGKRKEGSYERRDDRRGGGKEGRKEAKVQRERERKAGALDYEGVDLWAEPEWKDSDCNGPFLEESSFIVLFPQYRSQYIEDLWSRIKAVAAERKLKVDLDLVNKRLSIATTGQTADPYAIIKGRDFLKLIARGVPVTHAKRIFEPHQLCEVVKLPTLGDKERFARRRQRLIGPNGSTLKVLELVTNAYVCIAGQTAAVIGDFKAIRKVRQIVLDCMDNKHPVYNLKKLLVQRELEKREDLKDADWDKYLPHFKKYASGKRS